MKGQGAIAFWDSHIEALPPSNLKFLQPHTTKLAPVDRDRAALRECRQAIANSLAVIWRAVALMFAIWRRITINYFSAQALESRGRRWFNQVTAAFVGAALCQGLLLAYLQLLSS